MGQSLLYYKPFHGWGPFSPLKKGRSSPVRGDGYYIVAAALCQDTSHLRGTFILLGASPIPPAKEKPCRPRELVAFGWVILYIS